MFRAFTEDDLPAVCAIYAANDLPENCFPNLTTKNAEGEEIPEPLFVVKEVDVRNGQIAQICFLKMTSELYFFIDHEVGTPEERWAWLQEFRDHMMKKAWELGLDQMTAFIPTEIEASFGKRLLDLGFIKSPWQSYTLNLG